MDGRTGGMTNRMPVSIYSDNSFNWLFLSECFDRLYVRTSWMDSTFCGGWLSVVRSDGWLSGCMLKVYFLRMV